MQTVELTIKRTYKKSMRSGTTYCTSFVSPPRLHKSLSILSKSGKLIYQRKISSWYQVMLLCLAYYQLDLTPLRWFVAEKPASIHLCQHIYKDITRRTFSHPRLYFPKNVKRNTWRLTITNLPPARMAFSGRLHAGVICKLPHQNPIQGFEETDLEKIFCSEYQIWTERNFSAY